MQTHLLGYDRCLSTILLATLGTLKIIRSFFFPMSGSSFFLSYSRMTKSLISESKICRRLFTDKVIKISSTYRQSSSSLNLRVSRIFLSKLTSFYVILSRLYFIPSVPETRLDTAILSSSGPTEKSSKKKAMISRLSTYNSRVQQISVALFDFSEFAFFTNSFIQSSVIL